VGIRIVRVLGPHTLEGLNALPRSLAVWRQAPKPQPSPTHPLPRTQTSCTPPSGTPPHRYASLSPGDPPPPVHQLQALGRPSAIWVPQRQFWGPGLKAQQFPRWSPGPAVCHRQHGERAERGRWCSCGTPRGYPCCVPCNGPCGTPWEGPCSSPPVPNRYPNPPPPRPLPLQSTRSARCVCRSPSTPALLPERIAVPGEATVLAEVRWPGKVQGARLGGVHLACHRCTTAWSS